MPPIQRSIEPTGDPLVTSRRPCHRPSASQGASRSLSNVVSGRLCRTSPITLPTNTAKTKSASQETIKTSIGDGDMAVKVSELKPFCQYGTRDGLRGETPMVTESS